MFFYVAHCDLQIVWSAIEMYFKIADFKSV